MFEIGLLALWALYVGRPYLNLDPTLVPAGREWGLAVHSFHFWTRLLDCGTCALWNGTVNGGYPAFAEIYGSPFHPFVAIPVVLFGVANGAKIAVVLALWLGGIGQWWLAYELDFSRPVRLWTGLLAVVGGHLTGRMEMGLLNFLLAIAASSLIFPAVLAVAKGKKYGLISLALATASAILAGSGYIQIGVILALSVPLLYLTLDSNLKFRPLIKTYLMAGGITLLLSAPVLLPILNNLRHFTKDIDPNFDSTQPLRFFVLNLFIDNLEFFKLEVLEKLSFPYLYTLFIGWIPVLFVLVGLYLNRKEDRRKLFFLILGTSSALIFSTGDILRQITKILPVMSNIRYPSLIAGLAIPFILGLAGYGLERCLSLNWPKLTVSFSNSNIINVSTRWVLLVPLIVSLRAGLNFSKFWLYTVPQGPGIDATIEQLTTDELQWVQTPFGEQWFYEPAIGSGLKLSQTVLPYRWKDYEFPDTQLSADRNEVHIDPDKRFYTEIEGIRFFIEDTVQYAAVHTQDSQQPCMAHGVGANITVGCSNSSAGRLVVNEYYWSDWKAFIDGRPTPLLGRERLEVQAPTGDHSYTFQFRPWDVPLGFGLMVIGIGLSIWVHRKQEEKPGQEI